LQNESSGSARIATHPIGSAPRRSAKIFMKQLPSTSVACTVLARECTGRPVIGAIALAAIGLTTRRFDDNLRRIGSSRAPGHAADYSGGSDRRVGRMGGKIARKEAVGGKVAVVIAAVIVPAAFAMK
jgi:hypothetical protein